MSKTERQFAAVEILRLNGPLTATQLRNALRGRGFIASDKTFSRDETEMLLRGSVLFATPATDVLRTESVPSV